MPALYRFGGWPWLTRRYSLVVVLDQGWTALRERRWDVARTHFEEALAAGEDAEAYEGLSWAAWWLDDADAVFAAREHAYRLYKGRGDPAAAGRMATWLASDHLDFRGALSAAGGWLARAHRLLDPLQPGPDHGWLFFLEGYMAHQAGETERAAGLARSAAEVGERFGVADPEMLGLALEGSTLVVRARVAEGMRRLDEAAAIALQEEATIPISGAWVCCFLVGACADVQDYERAFEWCDRIADFAERYGSRYMLAFCRAEYGAVHLWRGRWEEAEKVLEASVGDFSRSRPAMVGGPLVALAELRRRQGRTGEAAALLERAGPSSAGQLCSARMALDRGEGAKAIELAERFLRQVPAHLPLARAPALDLLVRARAGRGELEEADAALAALREIERLVGTPPLRAGVDLAAGSVAAARGDHDSARQLLEDAVDRFDRCGAPFEAAHARIELAATLVALGRPTDGQGEAANAARQLSELGAAAGPPLPELTPREREVLALLAEGLTNRQIAERLVLSEHTVRRHVTNLLRKLGLPSRAAAAAVAVRSGLSKA
jgi:LuxR family transcriptional regulator, maltose regulon positive regulatory protein